MRRAAIERLLPAVYERAATPGSVLATLLDVMEQLHAPAEQVLARIEDIAAPYRVSDQLTPYLARWVGLDQLPVAAALQPSSAGQIPVGRLRDLIACGAELAQWRGTPRGLCRVLEIATGTPGFVVTEPRPFSFVVHIPAAAAPYVELVRQIVAVEKPAATTFEVVLVPTQDAGQHEGISS